MQRNKRRKKNKKKQKKKTRKAKQNETKRNKTKTKQRQMKTKPKIECNVKKSTDTKGNITARGPRRLPSALAQNPQMKNRDEKGNELSL